MATATGIFAMADNDNWNADGPYVVWTDHGSGEGWSPRSYPTLKEAVVHSDGWRSDIILTRRVEFDVIESGAAAAHRAEGVSRSQNGTGLISNPAWRAKWLELWLAADPATEDKNQLAAEISQQVCDLGIPMSLVTGLSGPRDA